MTNFYIELGKRIKHYRIVRGMTQAHLAEIIGFSFQQMQKYEAGSNYLRVDIFIRLATALDISPMDLLSDAPGMTGPEMQRQDLTLYSALSKCSARQKQSIQQLLETFT